MAVPIQRSPLASSRMLRILSSGRYLLNAQSSGIKRFRPAPSLIQPIQRLPLLSSFITEISRPEIEVISEGTGSYNLNLPDSLSNRFRPSRFVLTQMFWWLSSKTEAILLELREDGY